MSLDTRGWSRTVRWLAVIAVLALTLSSGGAAVAQNTSRFGENVEMLPGIVQAVSRHYGSNDAYLHAFVFAFETGADAQAALETLDAEHQERFTDDSIAIDPVGTETRAYTHDATWTEVLTWDGPYVYVVSAVQFGTEVDLVELATNLIQTMIDTEAGEGLGEFDPDGNSTGGLWDKLPPGGGEALLVFWSSQDEQHFPERTDPEDGELDFGGFAGIQRAVARNYSGDTSVLATPETAPATTYFLGAAVAAFDSSEDAAAALEPIHAQSTATFTEEFSITPEPADPGDIGDQVRANVGTTEQDGLTVELTTIVVQDGAYVYVVAAVGVGTDTGVLETATGVIETMIAAGVGSGDGTFDETGGSTGGLWDKFPAEGDAALNGLVPEEDSQLYP